MTRPFTKPALPVEKQVELLRSRGLVIDDARSACESLAKIGYYRFSGYALPFEIEDNPRTHRFRPGGRFEDIIAVYEFDRHLRLIALSGIERAEVALRARISDVMSAAVGPHWFLGEKCFHQHADYKGLIAKIESDINHDPRWERKRSVAVRHYYETYSEPRLPPSWTIMEELSLGTVSRIFADLAPEHRKRIAHRFRVDESLLTSWLRAISYTRNLCAHHSRLWNRKFTLRPKVGRDLKPFLRHSRNGHEINDRVYAQILVLRTLLAPLNEERPFIKQFCTHMGAYPQEHERMGCPVGWERLTPWQA